MVGLGTFTGAWFLYFGLVLISIGPLTALFVVGGNGMLILALTRAFDLSWGSKTRPV
jgi:hypothetical protein